MSEEIPAPNSQGATEGADVGGVVLDRRVFRIRGSGRPAASTLVVQNDLAVDGERRERRPEHGVVVQQPAVYADDRRAISDRWAREDGEIHAARPNGVASESWRAREGFSERNEVFVHRGKGDGDEGEGCKM